MFMCCKEKVMAAYVLTFGNDLKQSPKAIKDTNLVKFLHNISLW